MPREKCDLSHVIRIVGHLAVDRLHHRMRFSANGDGLGQIRVAQTFQRGKKTFPAGVPGIQNFHAILGWLVKFRIAIAIWFLAIGSRPYASRSWRWNSIPRPAPQPNRHRGTAPSRSHRVSCNIEKSPSNLLCTNRFVHVPSSNSTLECGVPAAAFLLEAGRPWLKKRLTFRFLFAYSFSR